MTTETPIAFDSETHRIGPGAVVPPMVCGSFAMRQNLPSKLAGGPAIVSVISSLYAACEPRCLEQLQHLLEPGNGVLLIGHNLAYDLAVAAKKFPSLVPAIFAKLARWECTDTMLREQLINLATHGKLEDMRLPDGSTTRISYTLEELVATHLGIDLSGVKKGADSWRLRFNELDGIPAAQYPREAYEYAREDAELTLQVYEVQEERLAALGHDLKQVDRFQTMAAFALLLITDQGMPIDPVEFHRLERMLAVELSDEKMAPLIAAGLLRPSVPALPYARQEKKARELVQEISGELAEDVDFHRLDPEMRQILEDCGVKFKAPEETSKNLKAIKSHVLRLTIQQRTGEVPESMDLDELMAQAEALQVDFKTTDTGQVCTDGEVVDALAPRDSVMKCLSDREALGKLVSTELPRMTWEGKPADVVHFCYRPLVETGRTSSYASKLYPSANGQNVDPRARPVYIPRPGFVLCSTDYASLELACVAQATYELFGESVHRDKINAGVDPHAYLGATLALDLSAEFRQWATEDFVDVDDADIRYRYFASWKPENHPRHKFYKAWRKLAKPVGLGLPGGLGPAKLVEIARKDPYNVDIVGMACKRYDDNPAEFDANRTVRYYAKKEHRMCPPDEQPGKGEVAFRWTPFLKGIWLAQRLRALWLKTYPEMPRYFEWIQSQKDEDNSIPAPTEDDPDREVEGLRYLSPLGMLRRACTFTSAANGFAMQTRAAEGFKQAIFDAARACRDPATGSILFVHGCRLVNEVHDELIFEVPEAYAHECAMAIRDLMVKAMTMVIRDVTVRAEPCLMRRWYKQAEPVYVAERLVPWEPKKLAA